MVGKGCDMAESRGLACLAEKEFGILIISYKGVMLLFLYMLTSGDVRIT